ncbi:MAG: hypothetical protein AAF939_22940, partial [Planctomycetota bacterium]
NSIGNEFFILEIRSWGHFGAISYTTARQARDYSIDPRKIPNLHILNRYVRRAFQYVPLAERDTNG